MKFFEEIKNSKKEFEKIYKQNNKIKNIFNFSLKFSFCFFMFYSCLTIFKFIFITNNEEKIIKEELISDNLIHTAMSYCLMFLILIIFIHIVVYIKIKYEKNDKDFLQKEKVKKFLITENKINKIFEEIQTDKFIFIYFSMFSIMIFVCYYLNIAYIYEYFLKIILYLNIIYFLYLVSKFKN